MSNWTLAKLGELVNSYAGGTPSRDRPEYFGGSIPWIKSTEINLGKISKTEETLTEIGLKSSSAKWIPDSSVLIALYGATAAQVAFLEIEATANQAVLALVPSERIDSLFLFHLLTASKSRLLFLAQGSGQPNLNKKTVDSLVVNLPPFSEQKQIADVLSTIDLAISQTQALIAKQQRIKTGLMQDLLTKGIDENGNIRSEETHEFKDSPLDRIPVEWEIETLNNLLVDKKYGISSSLSEQPRGIPVLRMNNLVDGEIDFFDLKYSETESAKNLILNDLDVLFNRTNSIEYVGRTAIYRHQGQNISFASYIVRLVPKKTRLDSEYLNLWLNDAKNQIRVKHLATLGVQQANINPTNLGTIVLALPKKITEQKQIVKILVSVIDNLWMSSRTLQKLRLQKTALMQDLLTGKVRVTELLKEREKIRP